MSHIKYPVLPLLCGVGANALWGAAFVIPYLLKDFSSELLTLARYTVYGLISVGILLLLKKGGDQLTARDFLICNLISFCGNVGYYLFLTMGIKYCGYLYPTLIIGLLPVAVIFLGAVFSREMHFRKLLLPLAIIAFGAFLLNFATADAAQSNSSLTDTLLGIGASLVALFLLTSFCLVNARYLKQRPQTSSLKWTAMLGFCSLLHSALYLLIRTGVTGNSLFSFAQFQPLQIIQFGAGAIFLGLFVSYLAMLLWNIASRKVANLVAGQILCLEAIFALGYGYLIDSRLPSLAELSGVTLVLFGAYLVQFSSIKPLESAQ